MLNLHVSEKKIVSYNHFIRFFERFRKIFLKTSLVEFLLVNWSFPIYPQYVYWKISPPQMFLVSFPDNF